MQSETSAGPSDQARPGPRAAADSRKGRRAGSARGRGLRFKFLVFNLSIALLSASLLFGLWEYFFHARALDLLERKVDEVVAIQSSVLAVPVWNLEQDRIELILRAILKDEDFVLALVTDEEGNSLVRVGEAPDPGATTVTTSSAIVHGREGETEFLGELTLVAGEARLAELARERLLLDLFLILLLLTSAIVAALIAFRRTIEIPLSRLLKGIYSAKYGRRSSPVVWNSADEMGVVVSEFNDLQARQARYEDDLKAARDNLEQRVEARTAELRTALEAADVANKAKSEFLAVMSHELRTPLNGVLGLTDAILAESLPEQQREKLLLVRESGTTLLELLNDLLDVSKIEAGSIEFERVTFDLQELLDRIARFWQPLAEDKSVGFHLELPDGRAPLIHGDPMRLRQVLFNLLNNALKFTEQGAIRLRVDVRDDGEDYLMLRFEVIDSGIGIEPEVQDKLFKRFSQADSSITRKFGGSGLGLSICRELSALMGGEVGVESVPGEGSTFWFTARYRRGQAEEAVDDPWPSFESELPEPCRASSSLRILVAEDNKVNQLVIDSLVGRLGHRADIVPNGEQAVRAVREQAFDLVLMDIQMPEMDGCTATRQIRALEGPESAVPIIALTANAMRGDRERYLACGMTDYVAKPIEPEALRAAISRCTGSGPRSATVTPLPLAVPESSEDARGASEADAEEPEAVGGSGSAALEKLIGRLESL